ncbi:MAG: lysostaphin resistance A-like protein [Candidatus Asgardarchaeia archaeon]
MDERTKKIGLFIGITFSMSWTIALLFFTLVDEWYRPADVFLALAYMFVPMVASVIVQKLLYKEPLKEPLGISLKLNRWFLAAWLIPLLIVFSTIGVSPLIPGVEFSPEMEGFFELFEGIIPPEVLQQMKEQITSSPIHPFWIVLIMGLVAGITVNAVAGFGEELGWRGFLQKELDNMGFWSSSLVIGLIWGIWHAPIILHSHNYPQHPVIGVFMMVVFCVLLAPIFSYVRIKAKSVIAASILHGSLNSTGGLAIMVIKGGNDLTVGVTGIAGFIALLILNVCIFLFDRSISGKSVGMLMETDKK